MSSLHTQYAASQRVCALNNHGVKSLNLGDISTAHCYFAEALETAKELILFSQREQTKTNADLEDATAGYCFSYSSCNIRVLEGCVKGESTIYVCDRPLTISPGQCRSSERTQPIRFLCSLILFNMALLHHALGLHHESRSSLEKAGRLYKRCILMASVNKATAHNNKGAALMVASARTNMAQIALEHGNVEVARQYLKQLGTICRCRSFANCDVFWISILSNVLLEDGLNTARAA
mmetsp:Transcript_27371/g.66466  ORF Transcript_27371/g.66466 Transcript_27371/m.66466 type:complete len:236 (+) Transcript_27371:34-741(+)